MRWPLLAPLAWLPLAWLPLMGHGVGCASALDEQLLPESREMPEGAVSSPRPDKEAPAEPPRGAIAIAAQQAEEAGLPAMTVLLAAIPQGVTLRRQLVAGTFVELVGPRSRPLSLRILAYGPASSADLPGLIEALGPEVAVGSEASVILVGAPRHARGFISAASQEKLHGCAVMVPSADAPERGALVVIGGPVRYDERRGDAPSCDGLLARPSVAMLLDGLTIR
jgi:hypothetical protein